MGLREYVSDMWNVVDFVTNSLYVATIALRIVAYYKVCVTPLIDHHLSLITQKKSIALVTLRNKHASEALSATCGATGPE